MLQSKFKLLLLGALIFICACNNSDDTSGPAGNLIVDPVIHKILPEDGFPVTPGATVRILLDITDNVGLGDCKLRVFPARYPCELPEPDTSRKRPFCYQEVITMQTRRHTISRIIEIPKNALGNEYRIEVTCLDQLNNVSILTH